MLEHHGFKVKSAGNVTDALTLISSETFQILLTNLHMPGAGDGLTVVSSMRHANPAAVTMLLSPFPEMDAAAHAIPQGDEILVKPMRVPDLVEAIKQRFKSGPLSPRLVESVATILERTAPETINYWFTQVEEQASLTAVPLREEERFGHLPHLFLDLVQRLRSFKCLGTKELISTASSEHGALRYRQGYTASMMVEESRLLQVSIFRTLQNNLATIDFSILLIGVTTIADEVDSQLEQAITRFTLEAA